jgi:signal transduction histidine kinase
MQTQTPIDVRDAPVNILLVDDESANLAALEAVLAHPGYRLVRATSGQDALRALVAHEFACLLLDVQMPGMNGFELARTIQHRAPHGGTPIIFLTAHYQEDEHALEGYASGAVDYLHKPFHPAVLRRKVQIFADLHRTQRELGLRAAARDAGRDRAAGEAERRKDQFLGMLAHELRNPLAPISNAVHIIRGKAAAEPAVQWACDIIGRQTGLLTRLIDDLLDVARLAQGKIPMRREPVALADLVARAVESGAPLTQLRGQSVTVELPAEPVAIEGDAARLVQALSNLVMNAAKFSAPGSTIAIRATWSAGEVRVAVRDAGAGIAPEFLPHIFELFAQGEQSLERPDGGLGVGLTMARHIVELHGGRLLAHSGGLGQGTEMMLCLPAARAAGEAAGSAPAAAPAEPAPGAAAAPVRVLVVDDERTSAETLTALLEIKGFEVRMAHDGVAAVEAAQAFLPEVVLLDIGLPRLDGFGVAQRLRGQPLLRDALLIALTGYGDAETRSRAAQAGFDSHMTKPADIERLLPMLADPRAARQAPGKLVERWLPGGGGGGGGEG